MMWVGHHLMLQTVVHAYATPIDRGSTLKKKSADDSEARTSSTPPHHKQWVHLRPSILLFQRSFPIFDMIRDDLGRLVGSEIASDCFDEIALRICA